MDMFLELVKRWRNIEYLINSLGNLIKDGFFQKIVSNIITYNRMGKIISGNIFVTVVKIYILFRYKLQSPSMLLQHKRIIKQKKYSFSVWT